MKAEVLVNLAKEAGLKVEDLMLIRRHKEEFESSGMATARPKLLYTSRRGRRSRW